MIVWITQVSEIIKDDNHIIRLLHRLFHTSSKVKTTVDGA